MYGHQQSLSGVKRMFETILRLLLTSLFEAAPLALATLGIVLIFKTSFTTNFAQGSIGMLGAFAASIILSRHPIDNIPTVTYSQMFIAVIVGIIVGFFVAMFVDVVIFRLSKYANPAGKQIITMGLVLVIGGTIPTLFGGRGRSIPRLGGNLQGPFRAPFEAVIQFFRSLGVIIQMHQLIALVLALVIISILFIALRYTKWGLGVRATASNEVVAGMMGVNTRFITAMSWAIAGGLGALAAILISSGRGSQGSVNTIFMTSTQVNAFFSSIMGGFSTFHGPVIGAVIFSIMKNVFSSYLSPWGMTTVYIVVLIIVLIKPYGIFGKKIAKKV